MAAKAARLILWADDRDVNDFVSRLPPRFIEHVTTHTAAYSGGDDG